MIWKKIITIIVLLVFYLSPLSTLIARVVMVKTVNLRYIIGQSVAFISFLLVVMLWMKDFSASGFLLLKNYSFISKFFITILCFYVTALIITSGLR